MDVLLIKPLYDDAQVPQYATRGSAGFDLHAYLAAEERERKPVVIPPGKWALIGTGIAVALPENYELQVRPRSGLALKHGVTVLNTPGTVDADYRGEVGVILLNLGSAPFTVHHGDRIAQGIVNEIKRLPLVKVEELDETERGAGGFGHTGK